MQELLKLGKIIDSNNRNAVRLTELDLKHYAHAVLIINLLSNYNPKPPRKCQQ